MQPNANSTDAPTRAGIGCLVVFLLPFLLFGGVAVQIGVRELMRRSATLRADRSGLLYHRTWLGHGGPTTISADQIKSVAPIRHRIRTTTRSTSFGLTTARRTSPTTSPIGAMRRCSPRAFSTPSIRRRELKCDRATFTRRTAGDDDRRGDKQERSTRATTSFRRPDGHTVSDRSS